MGFSPVLGQPWKKLQHQTEVGLLAYKLSLQQKVAGSQSTLMFQIYHAIGCSMVSCKTGHKPFLARRKGTAWWGSCRLGDKSRSLLSWAANQVLTHCTTTLRDAHFMPCMGDSWLLDRHKASPVLHRDCRAWSSAALAFIHPVTPCKVVSEEQGPALTMLLCSQKSCLPHCPSSMETLVRACAGRWQPGILIASPTAWASHSCTKTWPRRAFSAWWLQRCTKHKRQKVGEALSLFLVGDELNDKNSCRWCIYAQ